MPGSWAQRFTQGVRASGTRESVFLPGSCRSAARCGDLQSQTDFRERELQSKKVKRFAKGHELPGDRWCLTLATHLSHSRSPHPAPVNQDFWRKRPKQWGLATAPWALTILLQGQNGRLLTQVSWLFSHEHTRPQIRAGNQGWCSAVGQGCYQKSFQPVLVIKQRGARPLEK